MMANRVIWQHDVTPEQAVATVYKQMEPQIDSVINSMQNGGDMTKAITSIDGPMKPVDYSKPREYYVEGESPDGELPFQRG